MTFKTRSYHLACAALALGAIAFAQIGAVVSQGLLSPAHAQDITEDDVANYASAVIEIEALRLSAYGNASDILAAAESETDILETRLSCTASKLSDMPAVSKSDRLSLRTVLVNFCNDASQVVEDNGFTPREFNAMTAAHQEDSELVDQIQAVIGELL